MDQKEIEKKKKQYECSVPLSRCITHISGFHLSFSRRQSIKFILRNKTFSETKTLEKKEREKNFSFLFLKPIEKRRKQIFWLCICVSSMLFHVGQKKKIRSRDIKTYKKKFTIFE